MEDRRSCKEVLADGDGIEYNIKHLVLPDIFGWKSGVASWFLNTGFARACIQPKMLRDSKFFILRTLRLPNQGTLFPLGIHSEKRASLDEVVDAEPLIKESDPMSVEFRFETVSDFVIAYRKGVVTPLDVANKVIKSIKDSDRHSPSMKIMIQWDEEEILRMAKKSTDRYKEGKPLSIFDGIPVAAKDEYRVAGFKCYFGTCFLGKDLETEETEAELVRKLRKGGAIVLGVTNMHEMGIGVTGCNPSSVHGTARNPYNPLYSAGGSSSGSGAAVSAGFCPIALGVDGGGSIRVPSALNGNVGFKASFGRFSEAGVYPFCESVSHTGPLCASVRDAAIAYAFLAGPDQKYPPSLQQPSVTLGDFENLDLTGIKIGIDWIYFQDAPNDVVSACTEAVKYLEEKCHATIVDIRIPEIEESRIGHVISILSEMAASGKEIFEKHYNKLAVDTRIALAAGRALKAADFVQAQRQRTRCMEFLRLIFEDVDAIITPATAMLAPKIIPASLSTGLLDGTTTSQVMKYMTMANFAGNPALVLPIGYEPETNLPISLQVMTSWWKEDMCLRIGHAAEGFMITRKKPEFYNDLLQKEIEQLSMN